MSKADGNTLSLWDDANFALCSTIKPGPDWDAAQMTGAACSGPQHDSQAGLKQKGNPFGSWIRFPTSDF